MKKYVRYIIPLVIIISVFLCFNFVLKKYQDRNSVPEPTISVTNTDGQTLPNQDTLKQNPPAETSPQSVAASSNPNAMTGSIPILMYHEIGDGPNALYVSVNNFRTQMHYLRDSGYHIITMAQAQAMLANHQIQPKTAVITFDDGYLSVYTQAWPILQECGFTPTVYICSSFPGRNTYLTWDQIKILQSGGAEIGSHTQTHPSLNTLSSDKQIQEIQGSKQILEKNLGVPVVSFCYPCGAYNQSTITAVKQAGYSSAVTTYNMIANDTYDLFQIPRLRINKDTTLSYMQYRINKP